MQVITATTAEMSALTGLACEVLKRNGRGGNDFRFVWRDRVCYGIRRTRIIGCRRFTYSAYLPLTSICGEGLDGTHYSARFSANESEIYPADGNEYSNWGEIVSADLPSELNALRGEERIEKVSAWYKGRQELAKSLIREIFPETRFASECGGDLSLCWQ